LKAYYKDITSPSEKEITTQIEKSQPGTRRNNIPSNPATLLHRKDERTKFKGESGNKELQRVLHKNRKPSCRTTPFLSVSKQPLKKKNKHKSI
jgi:hypothetical protein